MFDVRIILVEPAGALNLGAVARVMKNMGLAQLWLVNPQCDRFSDGAQHMAVHAKDILEAARIVDTLPEALFDCHRAIATVGRVSPSGTNLPLNSSDGLSWLTQVESSAIVFGREDRGLSNAELQYCQQVMTIPTAAVYPSLNLAQAVGICCYHLRLLYESRHEANEPSANSFGAIASQIEQDLVHSASITVVEAFYEQLEAILLEIGFLYPHTAFSRMSKLRQLFNRANLTTEEVAMLRGILRQVNWAAQKDAKQ
ncbi:RNA methyltransferase [Pseudanabaena sp. PCC 6802]|uniref:RNA methyltransferase n=1 Tax=Pseudanabaena sp. PCC 6802 TaxID=118173 RepID=UPI000348E677|nr:RNA methyltransferase [Pseudanabaena sp. PCC 6802]